MPSLTDFINLNSEWMKRILDKLNVRRVESVHVALVDGQSIALGFEKNKRALDFPGGAADSSIVDPVRQALECFYREVYEELAVSFEVPLDCFVSWVIKCGKRDQNLLFVCVFKDIPADAIAVEMRRKRTMSLPPCYCEMSDFKVVKADSIGKATRYVNEQKQAVLNIAQRHRGEICSFSSITAIGHNGVIKPLDDIELNFQTLTLH